MNAARIEKQIDNKLNDQFRYFRREFMEAATGQGVTMPLELVEDRSGRFFTFVNANGPRYLLHIIHSQQESSTIMRCAISLLIVTMAILRRKLPENRPKASGTNWMSLLSGNINSWASQILSTISDGAAVSICINLLAKSKILVIRELILSLLALLVNTSEEAVIQMLTSPNHQQISAKEMEERYRRENPSAPAHYKLTIDEKIKFNPSICYGNCLAVMFAIVADNRNHFTIVSACAEVVIAMTAGQHKSSKIAIAIAQTSIQGPPPKERKESEQKTLLKTVLNPRSNSAPGTTNAKASAAAGSRVNSTDPKKRPVSRGEDSGREAPLASGESPHDQSNALVTLATWDAVHILIQFLHRFFRYTDIASPDQSWNSMSAGDRQRLIQAHNRIIYAVASMIALAPEIGYYIYQMPKARHIVVTSAKYFMSSQMIAPGGLPVKERGNSAAIVSQALEILSADYQTNYASRPGSRGGSPPKAISRSKSAQILSFTEEEGDETTPREKKISSAGSSVSNGLTRPSSRENSRGGSRADKSGQATDMLPVVKVSHHMEAKPKQKGNYICCYSLSAALVRQE